MTENFYNVLDMDENSDMEYDGELPEKNDNHNTFTRKKNLIIILKKIFGIMKKEIKKLIIKKFYVII